MGELRDRIDAAVQQVRERAAGVGGGASLPAWAAPLRALATEAPDGRRLRIVGLATYGLIAVSSLVWGLSGAVQGNALGAFVTAGVSTNGTGFVSVTNDGGRTWPQARIQVDGRWYLPTEDVVPGRQVYAIADRISDSWALPRPTGLFDWERTAAREAPGASPGENWRPSVVRVQVGGVVVEEEVGRGE